MKFRTYYDRLCDTCNDAVSASASLLRSAGPDTDDPEAPLLHAADHKLLCGGSACRHGWQKGDVARYEDPIAGVVEVVLHDYDGMYWVAHDENDDVYYPMTRELMEPVRLAP